MENLIKRKKKGHKTRYAAAGLAGLMLLGMAGCQDIQTPADTSPPPETYLPEKIRDTVEIDDMSVIENMNIYSQDDPDSIAYFYVTVRYGSEADGTNHTFNEVNNAVRFVDGAHADTEIFARALVQAGDENGPAPGMLGYGETESNATIRVRGNSSSLLPVKSYRLKLNDNAGLWRGQSNLALNKHGFDVTRFRNKLYFDALKEIEAVPGIRTQFAVMYIKDETSGQTEFENYGIFTQAEVPSKKYLANHGMDKSGYLYKAISFNFEPNEAIKNFDDPDFDLMAMENVISCRGKEDNQRLLELIQVINDTSVDIDYVIDNYFDRDNYEYWLAYNILMGNLDTTMQNFYLYSPLNGNKWYFIPWDGDACLFRRQWALTGEDKSYDTWAAGISNYWGIILHQRFLKYEKNRQELDEKVEELHSWLNRDYIAQKVEEYNDTIEDYVSEMPDLLYLGYTLEERQYVMDTLGDEVEDNYKLFKESLNALMPFWMYEPYQDESSVHFQWGDAYDFEAGRITYNLTVSALPDMTEPVFRAEGLEALSYEAPKELFQPGYYYWKVEAVSADGRKTNAFNQCDIGEDTYCGVMEYYIE